MREKCFVCFESYGAYGGFGSSTNYLKNLDVTMLLKMLFPVSQVYPCKDSIL